ncbi:MAG: response regulator [Acidobacteriota bacterium]|nr:response regulator [Acidobacteriota bacterium]
MRFRVASEFNAPTVLVVDDDDIVQATVCRALENAGYRVLSASGSREALEIARAEKSPIAVAVLDYGLADMRGTELGQALSTLLPGLRVLISSGLPAGSIELRPGQRFLEKPFNAQTLRAAVLSELLDA